MCDQATGLFPAPKQIAFSCSCPDVASMCKHVAAVLYGVGSRLDSAPELLFTLRGVDPAELVTTAAAATSRTGKKRSLRALDPGSDLAALFALDLEPPAGFEKVTRSPSDPRDRGAASSEECDSYSKVQEGLKKRHSRPSSPCSPTSEPSWTSRLPSLVLSV